MMNNYYLILLELIKSRKYSAFSFLKKCLYICSMVNIIFLIISVYLFWKSGVGIYDGVESYFERDAYCPKEFLNIQKRCDIVKIIEECTIFLVNSFVIIVSISNIANTEIVSSNKIFSFVVLSIFVVTAFIEIFNTYNNISKWETKIVSQWNKEKKISKQHDDEVRLYRQIKYANNVLKKNTLLAILVICLSFT